MTLGDGARKYRDRGATVDAATGAISSQYTYDPLGRGGSGPPAWMVWRLNHQGGNLQQWAQINGVDPTLSPSWQPAGGIQLINDATKKAQRPLAKKVGPKKVEPQAEPEIRNANPKLSFSTCLELTAASPAIIWPAVCLGSGLSCVFGPPGWDVLACREAIAGCTITAQMVATCHAEASSPH